MLVSVITPTTFDRAAFNEEVKANVQRQTYPHIEHLLDYSLANVGDKRNALCREASGEIIVHFDSDDLYASDWVTHCVNELKKGLDLTGLKNVYFSGQDKAWLYRYKGSQGYVCGATMAYWKHHWKKHPFRAYNEGEDTAFCAYGGRVKAHNYTDGFIARIHGGNTASHKAVHCFEEITPAQLPVLR